MKLCVIAAGDGSRLKNDGLEIPKPLIQINGITLIEKILSVFDRYNFDSLNIIINKKFESHIRESKFLKSYEPGKINCIYKSTPGSLFSLNELSPYVQDSPFMLMTIDSIYDENEFASFFEYTDSLKDADGVVAVTDFIDDEKPLWVHINSEGYVERFPDKKSGFNLVTGGIYYFKSGVIQMSDESLALGFIKLREFLNFITKRGKKIKSFKFDKIIDVDHLKDIITAETYLKSLRIKESGHNNKK